MSVLIAPPPDVDVALEDLGALTAISRAGGQGRVYRPARVPEGLPGSVVIKLYHRAPPPGAAAVLSEMAAWGALLDPLGRARLQRVAAWPLATVSSQGRLAGIAMRDVSDRFSVPFLMPSGRAQPVLLALEHLLGGDWYLERRGLGVHLDTALRAWVAERIAGALAFLHREAIVVGDLAPSNLLVAFRDRPAVCLIDCDSMVFQGRRALASVETGDWDLPAELSEPRGTRAADAYKLGLVVLRLFARSHDARAMAPHSEHIPAPLRPLLGRALAPEAANRPAAGEWQRELGQLLATGGLRARYPGPKPAPARVAPVRPRRVETAPASARRPLAPAAGPARAPLSALAWAAVLLVVVLLMIRLLAALPGQDSGFGGGPSASPGPNAQQYFYMVPGGGGR